MMYLLGIALTILCICSVMELALLLLILLKSQNQSLLSKNARTQNTVLSEAEPVDDASSLARARKQYEEELLAFQDLLNYNADIAYGIETPRRTEE